jgi:hypothetical protein
MRRELPRPSNHHMSIPINIDDSAAKQGKLRELLNEVLLYEQILQHLAQVQIYGFVNPTASQKPAFHRIQIHPLPLCYSFS